MNDSLCHSTHAFSLYIETVPTNAQYIKKKVHLIRRCFLWFSPCEVGIIYAKVFWLGVASCFDSRFTSAPVRAGGPVSRHFEGYWEIHRFYTEFSLKIVTLELHLPCPFYCAIVLDFKARVSRRKIRRLFFTDVFKAPDFRKLLQRTSERCLWKMPLEIPCFGMSKQWSGLSKPLKFRRYFMILWRCLAKMTRGVWPSWRPP